MNSIQLLIQENQNRLDTVNEFLNENKSNGSQDDIAKFARLNQERRSLEETIEQLKSIFSFELPSSTMKQADTETLKNLEYGDEVYRWDRGRASMQGFRFVGLMPSCKNYLIFEDGEMLTHLHISDKDGSFRGLWFTGKYDSNFVGHLRIQRLMEKIDSVKDIYFK